MLLGKNTGNIPAQNRIFGDPCAGTRKRLVVTATYASAPATLTYTCANVGSNPVTLTVTDNVGNTSSAPATVTVSVPPTPHHHLERQQQHRLDQLRQLELR